SMGMEPIQWDVDSLDWKDYDADTICQRVTSKLSPGSIVLFHNAALHTPEALPAILDHMAREGYSLLPISQLIYRENYTIDHAGRQFCQAQSEQ
ncbi:MAG: deacetylase, partial [Oscillospiraceae bacterium]